MKATVYSVDGEKKSDINLPGVFDSRVREDIALKYYEADKGYHPHSPSPFAGRRHSASGTISHRRHEWKGHYGKGISRLPRKVMWRRGTQFMWVGAEVASTRGGRRAHPPKVNRRGMKVNQKEQRLAFASAFASTVHTPSILKRYTSLKSYSL